LLRAFGLGAILFVFWLSLSGHYTPLITSLGVASCVLAVVIAVRMDVVDREGLPLHVGGRLWLYLPWLLKEIFVANLHVARVILSPSLPIRPLMVRYRGTQETDLGRAIYGNSITLTPGTITTGIDGDIFQVHALAAEELEVGEDDEMNRRVTWVEQGR